jgi:hypothetical protein
MDKLRIAQPTRSDPAGVLPGKYYFLRVNAGSNTWTKGFNGMTPANAASACLSTALEIRLARPVQLTSAQLPCCSALRSARDAAPRSADSAG